MRKLSLVAAAAAVLCQSAAPAFGFDFLTQGVDIERTGWIKDEKVLNRSNASQMQLLWSTKLDSAARQMHNLFSPLIAEQVQTASGMKEIAIVAGISDQLWGIDTSNGTVLWTKTFDQVNMTTGGMGGILCPGGQTAAPTMVKTGPGTYRIYALSWDGRLRQVDAATGQETAAPLPFMQANAKPYALNFYNNVIYTSVSQGCGNSTFALFSYDLNTRIASAFIPAGGGLWGRRGVSVDKEGRIYQGTGDSPYMPTQNRLGNAFIQVKMDNASTLQLIDHFAPPNANWAYKRDLDINVTPMVVDHKGEKWVFMTSKECRIWMADREDFGGANNMTTVDTTDNFCNDGFAYDEYGVWGSIAAYEDTAGTLWIYAPFWGELGTKVKFPVVTGTGKLGGVAAFKVQKVSGKWKMVPAWANTDLNMGEEAIVGNGVVFAYGSGEDTRQQGREFAYDEPTRPSNRIANSTHATLYALDAATGRVLWNSGDQIKSWNHFSGLTVANGKAYLGTFDGTLYAFGVR